jgi:hypothetical protein
MEVNKVVVRFKKGTLMKGKITNFFPDKPKFHLELLSGELAEIDVEQLKAIFFVKDFEGDKARKDTYKDAIPGGGRKVQVKFLDQRCYSRWRQKGPGKVSRWRSTDRFFPGLLAKTQRFLLGTCR